jgi:DNA-binding winged helix-turn-helix (wHTH) protein
MLDIAPAADASVDPRVVVFRFRDFALIPAQRSLTCSGEDIPLAPKPFDILVALIENRHRVLHKNDLHRIVWRDIPVSDGCITQSVFVLREALRKYDPTSAPIVTKMRRGYRFILEVSREVL